MERQRERQDDGSEVVAARIRRYESLAAQVQDEELTGRVNGLIANLEQWLYAMREYAALVNQRAAASHATGPGK